ncbi:retrovirus-related pol polyprotein from transposon TNT 1-94 [Tanacetum coccineum]
MLQMFHIFLVQIVLWYLDFGCSKHMTGNRSQLTNFIHKFLNTVKFGNDQIAKIIGNVTISRVYYVKGLGHNLFPVGQFCDSDLEVALRKQTCFVRNLEGVDILSRSQETNLYTLSIGDMMASSLICLLSKASKTKFWLSHRRLSHLKFGAINHLARHGHEKYILVIVDDYSRFTWAKFLASKDEAPDFIIKFMRMIQVRLNATVRNIRTDNGTNFVNKTLCSYYESVSISNETSVARTLEQNGVVERRNYTLVEVARTMLIYIKAPLFLWAELTVMASEQSNLGPALHEMTHVTPSLGLVPNPTPPALFVPPSRKKWDLVFQPVFDEFYSPPASVASPVPVVEAPAPVESTGSPSSTSVDQNAPSPSTSQMTQQSQSQEIPLSADEESHDLEVAHMSNDSYFGILIPETISKESSSSDVIPTTVHSDAPIS